MTEDRFMRMALVVFVSVVVGVLVVAVVTSTLGVRAQQAPVGDKWADNCDEAETIRESGTYDGTINSPDDVDVLGVELPQKGAYVTVQPVVPTTEGVFMIDVVGNVSVANKRFQK